MSILLDGMKQQRALGILSALEEQQTAHAKPAVTVPTLAPSVEASTVAHNFVQLNSAPISQKISSHSTIVSGKKHANVVVVVGMGLLLICIAVLTTWWLGDDEVMRMQAESLVLTEQLAVQKIALDAASSSQTVNVQSSIEVNDVAANVETLVVAPVVVESKTVVAPQRMKENNASVSPKTVTLQKSSVIAEPEPVVEINQSARLLAEAGDMFRNGNFNQAIMLYRQVLDKQPKHKQALLGLLASLQSSSASSDEVEAVQNTLMRYYPFDADVNMLVFDQLSDHAESMLKGWIRNHPRHALLHYKLGAYYVGQSRWPEAQSAFFDAVSIDKQQPEYLANLAIAYDHLGKRALAIEYYQSALSMAAQYPKRGGMNIQSLSERLRYLQSVQE